MNNQFSSIGDIAKELHLSNSALKKIKKLGGFGVMECGIDKYAVCFATMSIIKKFCTYKDLKCFTQEYGTLFSQSKVVVEEFDGFSVIRISIIFND